MPNCRKLELTIRQQASIVYALDGYGASDALTPSEKGEIIDLICLIQSADVLAVEFASGRLPTHIKRSGEGETSNGTPLD